MEINLWTSTSETAEWFVENTILQNYEYNVKELLESDGNRPKEFHRVPEAIKRILYLDAADIILEINQKPVFVVEISHEAGTGHNSFQRFARIAAAAENKVPVAYIYPEASFVRRSGQNPRWDKINPTIFKALENVMRIHFTPALLYYYPTEYDGNNHRVPSTSKGLIHDNTHISSPCSSNNEIQQFFKFANLIIEKIVNTQDDLLLINDRLVFERRDWMQEQYISKGGPDRIWSPITATTTVSTNSLLKYIKKYSGDYELGDLLTSREETVIYQVDARLRSDPYPGALTALDYLITRIGENVEDRDKNLVLAWFKVDFDKEKDEIKFVIKDEENESARQEKDLVSINEFMVKANNVRKPNKCLLSFTDFKELSMKKHYIPRYFMQLNHSCTFTKPKEFRIYATFADAILFKDGCFWKDG